jgi:hypothetical protein
MWVRSQIQLSVAQIFRSRGLVIDAGSKVRRCLGIATETLHGQRYPYKNVYQCYRRCPKSAFPNTHRPQHTSVAILVSVEAELYFAFPDIVRSAQPMA